MLGGPLPAQKSEKTRASCIPTPLPPHEQYTQWLVQASVLPGQPRSYGSGHTHGRHFSVCTLADTETAWQAMISRLCQGSGAMIKLERLRHCAIAKLQIPTTTTTASFE